MEAITRQAMVIVSFAYYGWNRFCCVIGKYCFNIQCTNRVYRFVLICLHIKERRGRDTQMLFIFINGTFTIMRFLVSVTWQNWNSIAPTLSNIDFCHSNIFAASLNVWLQNVCEWLRIYQHRFISYDYEVNGAQNGNTPLISFEYSHIVYGMKCKVVFLLRAW